MEPKTLKKQAVAAVIWKFLERGGSSVASLLVQVVMARLLAPAEFGALAIMLVFIYVGNVLVRSGLNTALVQETIVDDDDCSTVFLISFLISLVLYGAVFVAAPYIASFYGIDIIAHLRVLALLFPISALNSVQVAIVQREMAFRKNFESTMIAVILSGAVGIALAIFGAGLWSLVIQQLLYQLIACFVLFRKVSWAPHPAFNPRRAKSFFLFGYKLLLAGLIDTLYLSMADLIVGKQFGSVSLGYLSQGKKYPEALGQMIDGAVEPVMLSAISKVKTDVHTVKRATRRALKSSSFLVFPIMGLFALVAEPLIRLFLGEQWVPAVFYFQVYCFVFALIPFHTANLQTLNGIGRSDIFLRLDIASKIVGLLLLLVAVFVFKDPRAVVLSYAATGVIRTFINAFPNKRIIDYSYFEQLRDIAPSLLLAVIAGAAAWPLELAAIPDAATILMQGIIMAAVYLGLAKLLHLESLEYLLATLKEMLGSRKGRRA